MPLTDPQTAVVSSFAVSPDPLTDGNAFASRHIGPSLADVAAMLDTLGYASVDELIDTVVPQAIRLDEPLSVGAAMTEHEMLSKLKGIASQNVIKTSMIGMGYCGTMTPSVILRNIMENPLWYTPYTPYQAELAQGRLQALLNFQTMVSDLTGLPLTGASLLDEATAGAEAMAMCHNIARGKRAAFVIADDCHPQTIGVCQTRAQSMGITLQIKPRRELMLDLQDVSGVLVQYPATDGQVYDHSDLAQAVHDAGALLVCAADLLALTLLTPPGQWEGGGADIVVGSTQRFGVPMGFGGPHAAYLATREIYARKMPGRIVGLSQDKLGHDALRLAIQTREQHIKRDKATSNICTAQVLLAVMAGMYAVWHGPDGLRAIAGRIRHLTGLLANGLRQAGHEVPTQTFFDTITVQVDNADATLAQACEAGFNLRKLNPTTVGMSLDETTTLDHVQAVLAVFNATLPDVNDDANAIPKNLQRTSDFLTHPVFHAYHTEHELLRYITRLQSCDVSLAHSMIPLGSCTMKLNAASEMIPVTWPAFGELHPFAPEDQTRGYQKLFHDLETWLANITGFDAVSLQPNAGSQGEYAGLLAIRRYHQSQGQPDRDICLIPTSAHGTNPASAAMAGLRIVPIQCDDQGNIDVADLTAKAQQHAEHLAALMITYPSTHGVFEDTILDICQTIHHAGGQVYMDGANMNAQVGLTSPGRIGADVCHLNLHKTFCIPHGGGGPGVGPIGVARHLTPFLPGHPTHAVAGAPFGSASILPISWAYLAMMGSAGLTQATGIAILNANYVAKRLSEHYDILYTGHAGLVAHEGIIDCRSFEKSAHVTVEDIAKRLMDFGFHAPTMSWPVAGTLMIEPTESESKAELDRFCDAMIAIRGEIADIQAGRLDEQDNPLKGAPHTAGEIASDDWSHPYSRKQAAYPASWLAEPGRKFWPTVARIQNAQGDRNLICTCPPVEAWGEAPSSREK